MLMPLEVIKNDMIDYSRLFESKLYLTHSIINSSINKDAQIEKNNLKNNKNNIDTFDILNNVRDEIIKVSTTNENIQSDISRIKNDISFLKEEVSQNNQNFRSLTQTLTDFINIVNDKLNLIYLKQNEINSYRNKVTERDIQICKAADFEIDLSNNNYEDVKANGLNKLENKEEILISKPLNIKQSCSICNKYEVKMTCLICENFYICIECNEKHNQHPLITPNQIQFKKESINLFTNKKFKTSSPNLKINLTSIDKTTFRMKPNETKEVLLKLENKSNIINIKENELIITPQNNGLFIINNTIIPAKIKKNQIYEFSIKFKAPEKEALYQFNLITLHTFRKINNDSTLSFTINVISDNNIYKLLDDNQIDDLYLKKEKPDLQNFEDEFLYLNFPFLEGRLTQEIVEILFGFFEKDLTCSELKRVVKILIDNNYNIEKCLNIVFEK